jgi:threonyl-tRNA synthetase
VQARVVSVSERHEAWAREVGAELSRRGFRVDLDVGSDKLGAKIRNAQIEKIPYMLVVGDREVEARGVAPRTRAGQDLKTMALDAFIEHLTQDARIPRGGSRGR